jgi:hypothetical protein
VSAAETMLAMLTTRGAYVVYALLVGVGLFVLVDDDNLVKKVGKLLVEKVNETTLFTDRVDNGKRPRFVDVDRRTHG